MNYRCSFLFSMLAWFICPAVLAQWVESNNGIYGGTITSLANYNNHVFAGTWGGVYHSVDNAASWKQLNVGLDNTLVNALVATQNGQVFVATQGGGLMFVTSEPFSGWTSASAGLPANPITTLAVISNQVFGITKDGLLFTRMEGNTTWTHVDAFIGPINSISTSGENLVAATDLGVYFSTDRGLNWLAKNTGLIEKSIYDVSIANNYVIAKARSGITFFSNDTGATWSLSTLTNGRSKLVEFKNVLYACNEFQAYFSANQGKTWETVRTLPGARDMVVNGTTLIAGNPFGVFKSTGTFPWTSSNGNSLTNSQIIGFAASPNQVFCATGKGDVLRSANIGKTWTSISRNLPVNEITAIGYFDNTLLVAFANYGIYRSVNDGASWTLAAGIAELTSLVKHKNQLVAGGTNGVYISSDKGSTWQRLTNAPLAVMKLLDHHDTLYAASPDFGISYSVNNGQTWSAANDGLPLPASRPTSLGSFAGLTLVGAEHPAPVYARTTISSPWQSASQGLTNATLITSFISDGRNIFAAGNRGVFISNTGVEWDSFFNEHLPPLSSPKGVESLIIHRNHLFAGTEAYGVWVSCIEPARPNISVIGNAPNDSTLVSDSPEGNQWYLNDSPIAGATQSTYSPVISGKYAVKLRLNDCESEMSEPIDLIVLEYPDAVIEMPNVFTPDGDDYNPVFVPKHYDHVSTAEMLIVDRWSKVIFRTADVTEGWDGGNMHAGVYYYQVRYIGKNGKAGFTKGWVHLIR